MPLDPRKKQKKLERRKAKDKARRQTEVARQVRQWEHRFERAGNGEILDCLVAAGIWRSGLGNVLISRVLENGRVAFGLFLLDVYCLGVKNAMFDVISRERYEVEWLPNIKERIGFKRASPEYVRKLVEEGVAYARSIGFEPHPDYRQAQAIFGDIDASLCGEVFSFGRDGKPFFINGPHDSPARCRKIIDTLQQHCGLDAYDYMLQVTERELRSMNLPQFPDATVVNRTGSLGLLPGDEPPDAPEEE